MVRSVGRKPISHGEKTDRNIGDLVQECCEGGTRRYAAILCRIAARPVGAVSLKVDIGWHFVKSVEVGMSVVDP